MARLAQGGALAEAMTVRGDVFAAQRRDYLSSAG